jgi:erythromycin esterase
LVVACSARSEQQAVGAPAPAAEPAAIEGQVLGSDGQPVAGVLVSVSSHFDVPTPEPAYYEQHTGADGGFRFGFLPAGQYGVTATPSNAGAAYGGVCALPSAGPCRVLLRVGQAGAAYRGVVRDEQGVGIAGAFNEHVGEVYVAQTDRDGRYAFELPPGNAYMLVADASPRPRAPRQVEPVSSVVDFQLDPAPAPRPSDAVLRAWLERQATPLALARELDPDAVKALGGIVGDAPLVALGETAHGTEDFTLWRRRVFQALVEHHGFSVYAVETSAADARAVEDYVVHGTGNARSAIGELWHWKNAPLLELVEWMRAYNADPRHQRQLHFAGIDPVSTRPAVELVAYVRRVDPTLATSLEPTLAPLARPDARETYQTLPEAQRARVAEAIATLSARLDTQRDRYITRSSAADHTRARQLAVFLERAAIAQSDYARRDEQMFATLVDLVGQYPPGTRVLLDAHAMHVAAEQHRATDLGRRLRERWGAGYVPIALTFGEGHVYASDWTSGRHGEERKNHPVDPAPHDTFEGALALAGKPALLLDLRRASEAGGDGIRAWLRSPQRLRYIGSRFLGQEESFDAFTLTRAFDGVLYVGVVGAVREL